MNKLPQEVLSKIVCENKSRLKAWREYKNMTQAELAEKLGIGQIACAQLERKGRTFRPETLTKLCRVLDITKDQLFEEFP